MAVNQGQEQEEMKTERLYLHQVIAIARKQWTHAKQKMKDQEKAISSAYEELMENAPDDLSRLYSPQGFYDLAELSQFTLPMQDHVAARETGMQTVRRLETMMDSPYFARINFRFQGESDVEKIYIGRATLMDQGTMAIHVHDWRAPISSVFYRFGVGKASFESPGGMMDGEVSLKRQYEIHRGQLKYFFDADVQVLDEFLKQLLTKHASPQMKSIVETIQKDQDIIIRDMQSDVLMVQGTAGSGKTSIALHRIAYLMYQGLGGKLNANDILIISPNTVFEEYISHVLPDLGENNVKTMLFEDIYRSMMPGMAIYARSFCMEQLLNTREDSRAFLMQSSMAFKGSTAFVRMLDRLVDDLPRRWIPFQDIDYDGRRIARRELMKTAICNSRKMAPLGMKLKWLEREVLANAHALHKGRIQKLTQFAARYPVHAMEIAPFARWLSIRESAVLLKEIRRFTELDLGAVYRKLFSEANRFYRLAEGLNLPENIEEIRRFTCAQLAENRLWHDDATALAYLTARVHGCGKYQHIRQVVLDEAQDAYPMHFAILRELFRGARYTILGDVNQTIGKPEDTSLYSRIGDMLGREKSTLVTLEKSFRCTMEIWRFSSRFLAPGAAGQCFSRSGDEPAIHHAKDARHMEDLLTREVVACKETGYSFIGLICKTEQDALALFERLKGRLDLKLMQNNKAAPMHGTLVIPLYLAKGLEFDAVLVCDADEDHYHTEDDKKLLYIACTRALHRLNLFYTGSISPLLYDAVE